jgi:excisionase family DNA binding protein
MTTRSQIERARTPRRTSTPRTPHRGSHGEPPVELLTVAQTAAWLGVSRSTIYRMLNTGRLPLTEFTIGNELRLSRRQLTAWLDQTPGAPTTQPPTRSSMHRRKDR